MTGDPELDAWQRQWKTHDAVPPDLRRRVEREIRAGRYAIVLPVMVTVLFGGGTLAWALMSGRRDAYLVATATWAFIAITSLTAYGLTQWIGHNRAPAAATATAFLEFMIQACRGKRAGIVGAAVLYPSFLVFMLVWRYRTPPTFASVSEYLLSGPVLTFAVITVALAVLGVRAYRRLGAELHSLRAMRRQFEDR